MASKKINFKSIGARAGKAAGLAAGVAASRMAGKLATKQFPSIPPVWNAVARLALGATLPAMLGAKQGDQFINNLSDGILTDAAVPLGGAFGVPGLSGTGGYDSISGDDYESLAYAAQQDAMSGTSGADSISGNLD